MKRGDTRRQHLDPYQTPGTSKDEKGDQEWKRVIDLWKATLPEGKVHLALRFGQRDFGCASREVFQVYGSSIAGSHLEPCALLLLAPLVMISGAIRPPVCVYGTLT
jgi:hypothetical protein